MTWIVTSPRNATKRDTKVARVDISYFPDGIDYEDILGRHFDSPTDRDWLASGGIVVLATADAYDKLKLVMDGPVDSLERTVQDEGVKLALERQIVALTWRQMT